LVEAGADIDAVNAFGNTPLHIACLNGHESVSRHLVASGADYNLINHAGQSAVHIAAASTQVRIRARRISYMLYNKIMLENNTDHQNGKV